MTIFRTASTFLLVVALTVPGIVLAQSQSASVAGAWQFSCTTRRGRTRQVSVQLTQRGATLIGAFRGSHGSGKLNGRIEGHRVSLSLSARRGSVSLSGTVADGTMSLHSARGLACSATRES